MEIYLSEEIGIKMGVSMQGDKDTMGVSMQGDKDAMRASMQKSKHAKIMAWK